MIHISKTKTGFQVTTLDEKNGEVINSSKGLSSKAACYKNIKASAEEHGSVRVVFQDDTLKKPKVFKIYQPARFIGVKAKWIREEALSEKAVKPYLPK